jgi:hypothetical protein
MDDKKTSIGEKISSKLSGIGRSMFGTKTGSSDVHVPDARAELVKSAIEKSGINPYSRTADETKAELRALSSYNLENINSYLDIANDPKYGLNDEDKKLMSESILKSRGAAVFAMDRFEGSISFSQRSEISGAFATAEIQNAFNPKTLSYGSKSLSSLTPKPHVDRHDSSRSI